MRPEVRRIIGYGRPSQKGAAFMRETIADFMANEPRPGSADHVSWMAAVEDLVELLTDCEPVNEYTVGFKH